MSLRAIADDILASQDQVQRLMGFRRALRAQMVPADHPVWEQLRYALAAQHDQVHLVSGFLTVYPAANDARTLGGVA